MTEYRAGLFLRIDTTPPCRFWAGVGDFEVPDDTIEDETSIYSGLGEIIDLGSIEQLINGVSTYQTFSLSGVPAELLALAETGASGVRGRRANIGFMRLAPDYQPSGAMLWLREGDAETVEVERVGGTRTIRLQVAVGHTDRRRARLDTYTPAQQALRSPTDRGLEYVPSYHAGSTSKWA